MGLEGEREDVETRNAFSSSQLSCQGRRGKGREKCKEIPIACNVCSFFKWAVSGKKPTMFGILNFFKYMVYVGG